MQESVYSPRPQPRRLPARCSEHPANEDPRHQEAPDRKVKIKVETAYAVPKPAGPLNITMKVNGEVFATFQVPISAPLLFTANDCLDIGIALGSPVSLDYCDKAPFKFNGTIEQVHVEYVTAKQKPAIQEGRAEDTKKEPVAAT
jgi:hypothetical protein